MSHIKKNDTVKVLSGKERGKKAKVLKVLRDEGKAIVERVNFVKRHMRAGGAAGQRGGIIEKEAPLPLAKLQLVCPKCSKPARVGTKLLEDGHRSRYCKKCNELIDG